jgi:hypothetical protein
VPKDLPTGSYDLSVSLDVAAPGDADAADGMARAATPLLVSLKVERATEVHS